MKQTKLTLFLLALATVPAFSVSTFIEDFSSGTENWAGAVVGTTPVNFVSTGGAPGFSSGYLSSDFAFSDAGPFGATLFRAQSGLGSSGGAFAGNYLESNVTQISLFVRHNAGVDISFNLRVANPNNSPGFGVLPLGSPLVSSGEWTQLVFPIGLDEAFIQQSGTPTTVLPNVGNLQLGASNPFDPMDAGFTAPVTFDLDAVTVNTVPEPSAIFLSLLGLAGLMRRKRN